MHATRHKPVLAAEIVAALAPKPGGFYVDGTFGGGGYAKALLGAADCRVLGLDQDPAAIARGRQLEKEAHGRLFLDESRFSAMEESAHKLGETGADGIALDLGYSSDQLEDAVRGFSFSADGPLDMRLSGEGPSAADLLADLDVPDLERIFRDYGEEPLARRIAKAIVAARVKAPITRTRELAVLIESVAGPKARAARIHPATRSFQALRIAVNDELMELVRGLAAAERLLRPAGRLAVVAFHSLEDRIVKRFLAGRSATAGGATRHRPEAVGPAPSFSLLFSGARKASDAEVSANPRARSARLRAAIRTDASPHPIDLAGLGLPALALFGARS